jgi:predicted DNA-binding antitoxin AbrB/MazE fold protein
MESTPIDAIYENGLFRPVQPLSNPIPDGEHVRLRIEEPSGKTILEQAWRVYDGLTPDDVADVERIGLQRNSFFEPPPATR